LSFVTKSNTFDHLWHQMTYILLMCR